MRSGRVDFRAHQPPIRPSNKLDKASGFDFGLGLHVVGSRIFGGPFWGPHFLFFDTRASRKQCFSRELKALMLLDEASTFVAAQACWLEHKSELICGSG